MPKKDTINVSIQQLIFSLKETICGLDYSFLAREYEDMPKQCAVLMNQSEKLCKMIRMRSVAIALRKAGVI
jgi:hypothetical protein